MILPVWSMYALYLPFSKNEKTVHTRPRSPVWKRKLNMHGRDVNQPNHKAVLLIVVARAVVSYLFVKIKGNPDSVPH